MLLIVCIPIGSAAEIRSLWVMPWSLTTPAKIDHVIKTAVECGYNEILVEVRYRSDALYQPNRRSLLYYNPEPRSYILSDDGFDPLAYAIEKGHQANLAVQAWVVVYNATPVDPQLIRQNHIYQNYPDWLTYDNKGSQMRSSDQYGYFLDPGVAGTQDYLLDVLSDIADGYPELDGLHLDYIRYPNINYGYHPESVRRFESKRNSDPDLTWNQWRQDQVTEFVRRMYDRIKRIKPEMKLTAAVIANYNEAVNLYGQSWETWLAEGIIDTIYPMLYNADTSLFVRNLDRISKMTRREDIVIGLRAWNNNGSSLANKHRGKKGIYTLGDLTEKMEIVLARDFGGLAFFSLESLLLDDAIFDLDIRTPRSALPLSETTVVEKQLIYPPAPSSKVEMPPAMTIKALKSFDPMIVFSYNPVLQLDQLYEISLVLPESGAWKWELRDESDNLIFQRYRYYLKGENKDFWNGVLDSGRYVGSGLYSLSILHDDYTPQTIPLKLELLGD